ncbi:hypothetical protein [Kitasatospora sp. NPDC088134]
MDNELPVYICDVCEDDFCGHCTGCMCPDCTEDRATSRPGREG